MNKQILEDRDKRALRALECECGQAATVPKQSYYVNGERHVGPHKRFYRRWLHELKKQ